jgi:hypothetical protein
MSVFKRVRHFEYIVPMEGGGGHGIGTESIKYLALGGLFALD